MPSRRVEAESSGSDSEDYSSSSDFAHERTETQSKKVPAPVAKKEKKKTGTVKKAAEKETKQVKKIAKKEKTTEEPTNPDTPKRIPGNGNFVKATQKRVIGREDIPDAEEADFDATSVAELKVQLKAASKKTSGTKVVLWTRYKGREVEPEKPVIPARAGKAKETAKGEEKPVKKPKAAKPKVPAAEEDEDDNNREQDHAVSQDLVHAVARPAPQPRRKQEPVFTEIVRVAKNEARHVVNQDHTQEPLQHSHDGSDDDEDDDATESEDDGGNVPEAGDDSETDVSEEDESQTEEASRQATEGVEGNIWGEKAKDDQKVAKSAAVGPADHGVSEKPTLKRKKSSSSSDGSADPESKRLKLRGGAGPSHLRDLVPTDYFIPEQYLAMNLAQILTSEPTLLWGALPGWKPNEEITLQEYLARHPKQRHHIATMYRDGESPFTHDEEHWYDELPTHFPHESFADVLDRTPYIWRLWEDDEADGASNLWTDRWNPAQKSGFRPEYLDDGTFLGVVQRFPNFAQFILDSVDNGDLSFEAASDREELERMLQLWNIEKSGAPLPEDDWSDTESE